MLEHLNCCALKPAPLIVAWCRDNFYYVTCGFVESKPTFSGLYIRVFVNHFIYGLGNLINVYKKSHEVPWSLVIKMSPDCLLLVDSSLSRPTATDLFC